MGADTIVGINTALNPSTGLGQGAGVLATAEWLKLQAFSEMAINDNPVDEKAMRAKLNMKPSDEMRQDFRDTIALYVSLKRYCTAFQDTIKPGTLGLADDIVQYQRRADVIYTRLIGLLNDYEVDTTVAPSKLAALEDEWKKSNPSVKATDIRNKFQEYIGKLRDEAKERSGKANDLHTELVQFQKDLRQSASDFGMHVKKYKEEYGTASTEIDRIKQEIQGLDDELAAATKKRHDETIVLSTAPLYLLIPFFGPLIMAGVLIGVGVDFGLLVERIKGEVAKLEETEKRLSVKQAFYEQYKTGADLTQKTSDDLAVVLPLVEKLEGAWRTLTSDLDDLHKILVSGAVNSVREDWDFASLDLDTARGTWRDLKEQADQYRRFANVKAASNVTELSSGVRPAA